MLIDLSQADIERILQSSVDDVIKDVIKAQMTILDDGPWKSVIEIMQAREHFSNKVALKLNDALKNFCYDGGLIDVYPDNIIEITNPHKEMRLTYDELSRCKGKNNHIYVKHINENTVIVEMERI